MQLSRTRLVSGIVAAALPLAVLAGCGEDEPKPKFEEPTSASPSESSSPEEPVEPTPPAAMKGDGVEGAEAFVEYYFDVVTYAVLTGDTTHAEKLALPDCASCRGLLDTVDAVYDKGGSVRGGEMRAEDVRMAAKEVAADSLQAYGGRLTLDVTKQVVRGTGDGDLDGEAQASQVPVQIQVVHSRSGWAVAEWSQS